MVALSFYGEPKRLLPEDLLNVSDLVLHFAFDAVARAARLGIRIVRRAANRFLHIPFRFFNVPGDFVFGT